VIGLVDTTVRDGHQSLWSANALSTSMIAGIAPVMDRVGFHAIDFTSSTHMAMTVRWQREDPWERIRVVSDLMPETPLGFITPGTRFVSWERAPLDVVSLALRCVIRNGVRRIWIAESMNDVAAGLELARIAKDEGADEVLLGLVFSISPLHTDDYYVRRAREIAVSPHVDVLNLKDPGGLLTPERVRSLVPALRAAAPALPLEVHSHNTLTMAGPAYLEAARLGASFVCTAVEPLANGTSQPSAERTVANLRSEGFPVEVDDGALTEMSGYFTRVARRIGRPVGVPLEYDVSVYRHQLPGGMTSTLRRQLGEIGMEHRFGEMLSELPRVREELGWPIMVTPLSQFIGVQAFLNVTTGERYSQVPDEVVRFVLGHYGAPPGALDPDVEAKVLASPKADEFRRERSRLDLGEARARFGERMSDEELLLRMTLPGEEVDGIGLGSPPIRVRSPVVELVRGLTARPFRSVEVAAPSLRIGMRR
jgi:oxaloacetate decarboxylase alpha subunit